MGNAALLHRYGFTEPDNPFDIINIDLDLVIKWCSSSFSNRYARSRLSLWRRLKYSGCTSQNAEYFEISFNGEPQIELLLLLYTIFLAEDSYEKLRYLIDSFEGADESSSITTLIKITKSKCQKTPGNISCHEAPDDVKELLLTENVCSALVSLADMREDLYGSNSLEDDKNRLRSCCHIKERKLYHSLVLRVSERTMLMRLRAYTIRYSKMKKRKLKQPKC